jgi:ligand-binding SRPBCC domain-containing protein
MPTYIHRSVIAATMRQMIAFHEHPNALRKLTPPPIFVQVHRDTRTSLTEGEVELTLWFGPIPAHWVARHEPGPTETSFADRQIRGPLESWRHEHIFREVESGVELTDRVTYEHRRRGWWGVFTRLFFNRVMLRMLFIFRHWRTWRNIRHYVSDPVS